MIPAVIDSRYFGSKVAVLDRTSYRLICRRRIVFTREPRTRNGTDENLRPMEERNVLGFTLTFHPVNDKLLHPI